MISPNLKSSRPPLRDRLCLSIEALIDALNKEENLKGQHPTRSHSPPLLTLAQMAELAKIRMEEEVVTNEDALTGLSLLF